VTVETAAASKRVYPPNWKEISRRIRFERSQGQCECDGECGLHRTHPGPRRCEERDGQPAKWAKGIVVLTVAHLNAPGGPCQCDPLCAIEEHLKAMCQRCHLRYDVQLHVGNAYATRRRGAALGELF
jgi:hypothetical protein